MALKILTPALEMATEQCKARLSESCCVAFPWLSTRSIVFRPASFELLLGTKEKEPYARLTVCLPACVCIYKAMTRPTGLHSSIASYLRTPPAPVSRRIIKSSITCCCCSYSSFSSSYMKKKMENKRKRLKKLSIAHNGNGIIHFLVLY